MLSKYARKRTSSLINESDINEKLKYIENSNDYYITSNGKVYHKYNQSEYIPIKSTINPNGYRYIKIQDKERNPITRRLHRLVAKAFIPNPDNLPIVGHKDNNKSNSEADNLYWTTNQENINAAIRDFGSWNDKGSEDSQSHSVICYDKNTDEIIGYGSMCEAHYDTGVSKSTIARQCKNQIKTNHRSGLYFKFQNDIISNDYRNTKFNGEKP